MTVYTHNGKVNYDCTSIMMIVTDAPRESLDISDDWFEVDANEVLEDEILSGKSFAELSGWQMLFVQRGPSGERIEKWGRL